jgi:hypothetical protein
MRGNALSDEKILNVRFRNCREGLKEMDLRDRTREWQTQHPLEKLTIRHKQFLRCYQQQIASPLHLRPQLLRLSFQVVELALALWSQRDA